MPNITEMNSYRIPRIAPHPWSMRNSSNRGNALLPYLQKIVRKKRWKQNSFIFTATTWISPFGWRVTRKTHLRDSHQIRRSLKKLKRQREYVPREPKDDA